MIGQGRPGARDTPPGSHELSSLSYGKAPEVLNSQVGDVDLAALVADLPGGVGVVGSYRQRDHGRHHGKANEAPLKPTLLSTGIVQKPMSERPCHCRHPHDSHQRHPTGEWIHRYDEDRGPEPARLPRMGPSPCRLSYSPMPEMVHGIHDTRTARPTFDADHRGPCQGAPMYPGHPPARDSKSFPEQRQDLVRRSHPCGEGSGETAEHVRG
jgi:hypothetical protein